MTKQIMLVPKYLEQFQCIGSSCEDTCCKGWSVPIDKSTYKKYKKVKDTQLAKKLDAEITRNRSTPSDSHYASILLSGCQSCSMLSPEGLCEIQLKLGEDYLSTTCSAYPRVTNIINGSFEQSASMSCPEAARLALLNPEPMEFFQVPSKSREKYSFQSQLNPDSLTPDHIQFYFWDLRIFSIELIQNRQYTITDRILMLGLFYQNVQETIDNGIISTIPQLIEDYRTLVRTNTLRDALANIPIESTAQVQLLTELISLRIHIGTENQRYLDIFNTFLKGLSYEDGYTLEQTNHNYQVAYNSYYRPFIANHSYILENYLVNYIYKYTFPFYGQYNVFENYVSLALQYSLIKMHLIGISGFYKENLTVDHVITLIQSFSKTVEHNSRYLQIAYDYLQRRGFVSIAGMAIFLKNE
ncbi:lysine-N-methylase [Brevibacillus brevis]|uniref:Lysine-N-methylase n=1 Tax=Brevibacillus brevis TaxID=1393 RepID=A0A2Z4MPT4_BREBE|nr:flagellin lysine-N-methylase [Brevibacillus brevis]AWX58586.1 lysine-N-methylase [Brevibacillus brevis]